MSGHSKRLSLGSSYGMLEEALPSCAHLYLVMCQSIGAISVLGDPSAPYKMMAMPVDLSVLRSLTDFRSPFLYYRMSDGLSQHWRINKAITIPTQCGGSASRSW